MAEVNFKNRTLYHGDNLAFLRGMNSETVHLIATDPPFNKNRDFHATPDSLAKGARFKDRWSWERDVHEEWTDSIIDDWPAVWEIIIAARAAYGDDMGAFLCWLGVRLMEMHRVLRPDGSLYLHIDHTAHAYVKCLIDAIFGWKNFRNEIVWHYGKMSNSSKNFPANHDTILRYTKSDNFTFNPVKGGDSEYKERYKRFLTGNQVLYGSVKHKTDKLVTRRINKKMQELNRPLEDNDVLFDFDVEFKIQSDVIYVPILKGNSKERTGYPTQKPCDLYERFIKASSNEGDIVLDPFCGCATTPIAAERLKRQWVGMDIWDGALEQVQNRLARDTILRFDDQQHHVTLPKVHYETAPPIRTDDNEMAAPTFKLRIQRPVEPWQKLTRHQMRRALASAQQSSDGVICAGCGRVLEVEFMQLDHITPKAERGENHILNRILLCGPCNRRKRDNLTLRGLLRENKKKAVGWMKDESMAKLVQEYVRERAEWVRDHFDSEACQALIAGRDGEV